MGDEPGRARRWFRVDVDWDDEEWIFPLSTGSQLGWIKLQGHVKAKGVKGSAKAMAPLVAAKRWGIGEEDVTKLIAAATTAGEIVCEDGWWRLPFWEQKQSTDSTATERQRRHRGKDGHGVTTVTNRDPCPRDKDRDKDKDTGKPPNPRKRGRRAEEGDGPEEPVGGNWEAVDSVIDHLNAVTGARWQKSASSRKPINARLAEGFTVDDCKLVIEYKSGHWKGDEKMQDYLRPSTLFRPTKFPAYCAGAEEKAKRRNEAELLEEGIEASRKEELVKHNEELSSPERVERRRRWVQRMWELGEISVESYKRVMGHEPPEAAA